MAEVAQGEAVAEAINARGLRVRYGSFEALRDVSIGFKGRSVGLLGPNGAGKSTLIKTLLGLVSPAAGTASVMGHDIRRDPIPLRRTVGYVPERDCHIPGMSAVDYVTMGGELAGMPRRDAIQRAHEMLHFVGMGEARYRPVDGYSAGMKQRIKLAQAMVHDPSLLFLDEPTNGLDPEGRVQLLDILKDLQAHKDIRIVLSSHLLRDVDYVCDEVIVIQAGTVIHEGGIDALKHISERHWRVRARGDTPKFFAELRAQGCTVEREDRAYTVELPDEANNELIMRLAVETGCQLRELVRKELPLEEAFVRLLNRRGDAHD